MGRRREALAFVPLPLLLLGTAAAATSTEQSQARQILESAGVKGGLAVYLGRGDGRLTAALHAGASYLVHALDASALNVEKARDYIRSKGLYGPVSVEQWSGPTLPYAESMVNLLVSEGLSQVPMEEVIRVLAPGGVACVRKDGQWVKTVKPRPANIDEWTHFLHDAGGNAVAHDTAVGPPRCVQWVAGPRWSRDHATLASLSALVSAHGRVFYIVDEGPTSMFQVPPSGSWSRGTRSTSPCFGSGRSRRGSGTSTASAPGRCSCPGAWSRWAIGSTSRWNTTPL
jgi:SAM-dependent methyltransferase